MNVCSSVGWRTIVIFIFREYLFTKLLLLVAVVAGALDHPIPSVCPSIRLFVSQSILVSDCLSICQHKFSFTFYINVTQIFLLHLMMILLTIKDVAGRLASTAQTDILMDNTLHLLDAAFLLCFEQGEAR